MQRRDKKTAAACGHSGSFDDAQLYYLLGKDQLLEIETQKLPRLPKWQQLRMIDELGTIDAPGTLRVMAGLVASRAAGEAATAWLRDHSAWIKGGALEALAATDAAAVKVVSAALSGKTAAPPAKVNTKALEKEIRAIFTGIEASLAAQKGNAKKERSVLDAAFARYCEIRSALGDVTPEAYFTHHFADVTPKWKVDDATTTRWLDLAVAAADAD
jgi:hypothetical protein